MQRAQSAMEYLMTYGWSILVLAIVIAVLFNLGVFHLAPSPNNCIAISGYSCTLPVLWSNGTITVNIGQVGQPYITITATACSANLTSSPSFQNLPTPVGVGSGQKSSVSFPSCPLTSNVLGSQTTGYLWIKYNIQNGQQGVVSDIGRASVPVTSLTPGCSAPANSLTTAGGPYTVVVPANCGHVTLKLNGAGGGGGEEGGSGGAGGSITGLYAVSPGSQLYVWVGSGGQMEGAGGLPGGGAATLSSYAQEGGGGGCSAVATTSSLTTSNFIIVAGGGGGATIGGNGGASIGQPGTYQFGGAAFGGSQTGGGAGGSAGGSGSNGNPGGSFSGGASSSSGGGGGGCGYYGGGGGAAPMGYQPGAGGGGSNNAISAVTVSVNTQGGGGNGGTGNQGSSGNVLLTWSS